MEFFSHAKNTDQGRIGIKLLSVHLGNVQKTFNQGLSLSHNSTHRKKIFESIATFHDLGKYTQYFQDYLLDCPEVNFNLKSHSLFGALYYLSKYFDEDQYMSIIGYWLISQHHGNLQSLMDLRSNFVDANNKTELHNLNKRQNSIFPYASQVNQELDIDDIESFHQRIKPFTDYFIAVKSLQKNPDIRNYFQINYLFSLLIEADKLDASDTQVYHRIALPSDKVDADKGIPDQVWTDGSKDFGHLTQNQLRNLVRKRVVEKLNDKNILKQKIFTLTGPTGIGKTLTALDFALKLRAKIKNSEGYEALIIYALPFINIIEQADTVYRKLFSDTDTKILSHYQYADALSQQEDKYNDDGPGYNQKVMSLDTWQCDIVITTFVQFLQTLIGNRNRLLKKFNHYAGSIIILDEVQTIALKQLPLVGASLYYLSKFLDARIILMTATKPKVFELANEKILIQEGEFARPLELLGSDEDVAKVFQSFNRTALKPLIKNSIQNQDEFIEDYFSFHWRENLSCLIVVNTVKLSIDVYQSIKNYFDEQGIKNPLYYLSTNVVPAGRQALIEAIKEDVKKAKIGKSLKPLLISTQCVEAGVDLDFDMAFRDLSPIDSIIQVAGRVNREYNKEFIGSVFIIDFGKCSNIYGPMTEDTARNAIEYFTKEKQEIAEKDYLDLVSYYYNNICERHDDGFDYSLNFFKSMKELNYDGSEYSVSKYQVIENGFKTSSVFIECDKKATNAKDMFERMIQEKSTREEFEPFKRDFHQHIIAVPDYLDRVKELKAMGSELMKDILFVPFDKLEDYYHPVTGFIRDKVEESWGTIL